jgi:hypothetical protein
LQFVASHQLENEMTRVSERMVAIEQDNAAPILDRAGTVPQLERMNRHFQSLASTAKGVRRQTARQPELYVRRLPDRDAVEPSDVGCRRKRIRRYVNLGGLFQLAEDAIVPTVQGSQLTVTLPKNLHGTSSRIVPPDRLGGDAGRPQQWLSQTGDHPTGPACQSPVQHMTLTLTPPGNVMAVSLVAPAAPSSASSETSAVKGASSLGQKSSVSPFMSSILAHWGRHCAAMAAP